MLAAYVAGGRAGEVPAVLEAMKVGLCCYVVGQLRPNALQRVSCSAFCTQIIRLTSLRLCSCDRWRQGLVCVGTLNIPAVVQTVQHIPSLQISPKDSFEVAFNAACGLIESGKLKEAEQQLQLAVRVGEWIAASSTAAQYMLPCCISAW